MGRTQGFLVSGTECLLCSLHWPEGLKGEEIKKCSQIGTLLSKYNQQYHKLFQDIPVEEVVLKVCSCALQRDLLLQGRLYISPNWLCFHASLFGKDIKVVIPVVSVQMIKKTQDGAAPSQWPGHHHHHQPEVCLCVTAVPRQRV